MRKFRRAHGGTSAQPRHAADTLRQPLSFISRDMIADVFDSQTRGRKDMTACFTGHRMIDATTEAVLAQKLDTLLEALYQRGYRDFITGAALGFDIIAAESVLRLKETHADVRLIAAIPFAAQSGSWQQVDSHRYERMLYSCDETKVLSSHYYQGCMQARNRYMVDNSSLCICYLIHMKGGTMSTVAYAMRTDCPVVNLAMKNALAPYTK